MSWYTSFVASRETFGVASTYTWVGCNFDVELANTNGWTATNMDVTSSVPFSGNWAFWGSTFATADVQQHAWPQSLSADSRFLEGLNSSHMYAKASMWKLTATSEAVPDTAFFGLKIINDLGSFATFQQGPFTQPLSYTNDLCVVHWDLRALPSGLVHKSIPGAGAASQGVQIRLDAVRSEGTFNDTRFDEIELDFIHVHSGDFWDDTYLEGNADNFGFETNSFGTNITSVDGWTVRSGTVTINSHGNFVDLAGPTLSNAVLQGGSCDHAGLLFQIDVRSETNPMANRVLYRAHRGQAWIWSAMHVALKAYADGFFRGYQRLFDQSSVQIAGNSIDTRRVVTGIPGTLWRTCFEPIPIPSGTQIIEYEFHLERGADATIPRVYLDEGQARVISRPEYHWAYNGTGANSGWNPGLYLSASSGHEADGFQATKELRSSLLPNKQWFMGHADGWVSEIGLRVRHQSVDGVSAWGGAGWTVHVWEQVSSLGNIGTNVNTTNNWIIRATGSFDPSSLAVTSDAGPISLHRIAVDSFYYTQISQSHWNETEPKSGSPVNHGLHKARWAITIEQTAAQSWETGASSAQLVWGIATTRDFNPGGKGAGASTTRFQGNYSTTGSMFTDFGFRIYGDTEPAYPFHDGPMGIHAGLPRASETYDDGTFDGAGTAPLRRAMPFYARGTTATSINNSLKITRAGGAFQFRSTSLSFQLQCRLLGDTSNGSLASIPNEAAVIGRAKSVGSNSGFVVVNSDGTLGPNNVLASDMAGTPVWIEWYFSPPIAVVPGTKLWMVVECASYTATAGATEAGWAQTTGVSSLGFEGHSGLYLDDGTGWTVVSGTIQRGEVFFEMSSVQLFVGSLVGPGDPAEGDDRRQYPNAALRIFPVWTGREEPHV